MACRNYNNNGCSCGGCVHFVKSLSIVYDEDLLRITIPEMVFHNHDKICLCLVQAIPEEVTADTVINIEVGTAGLAKMPMVTRRGNYVYGDSLRTRKVYPLRAATDSSVLVLEDIYKLAPTAHKFPTVPEEFPPAPK